jgi:hypothetical protein
MQARPPMLLVVTVAVVTTVVAACEAKVYGASSAKPVSTHSAAVNRLAQAILPPEPTPAGFGELQSRIQQATDEAAADGATLAVAVLDRVTDQLVSNGNQQIPGIASVAKLFIADELLLREARGGATLSADDRTALDVMLRSSDDGAAEQFWNQLGGDAIITEIAGRYGLTDTAPPSDGRWWNTISTPADLVRYYRMVLDGSGGLPPERATTIINNLAQSTPNGIDGYPQRFGIPEGLYAEPVAVKQGWMCCIGEDWMHLSTGVIGADRRYIMVVESLQPSDDATARATITKAVKTLFPSGRI